MWCHLDLSRCPWKVFTQLRHEYQLADSNYETPQTERCISISEFTSWKCLHLRIDEVEYIHFTVEKIEPQRGYKLLEGT